MNKLKYIYTMEEYLAIKINKQLIHAKTWMNLKNITLSKRSQKQNTYCEILFYMKFLNKQKGIILTQSRSVFAWNEVGCAFKSEGYVKAQASVVSQEICHW